MNPTHTFANPNLTLQCSTDEKALVASFPSGRERAIVTAEVNDITGGIDIVGMSIKQYTIPTDYEVMFARPTGPKVDITVPTPYAHIAGDVVHPAIVFIPEGLNEKKYWMAYTPLPNGNNVYENPCICASDDGIVWDILPGTPNPLNEAVSPAYNRDTHLYYRDGQLILIFNTRNEPTGRSTLKIITSTNGVSWSDPVSIWLGTVGTVDIVSPSLWFDPTVSKWIIVGVNSESVGLELCKITSSNLLYGWDISPVNLNFVPPTGRKWWHPWFTRLYSGRIIGVVMDNDGSVGASGYNYVAQSLDGATFEAAVIQSDGDTLRVAGRYYRPTMFVRHDGQEIDANVIYSHIGSPMFYKQKLEFKRDTTPSDEYRIISQACVSAGVLNSSALLAADNFVRADSPTSLGSTLDGKVWVQIDPANPIGISGNAAYAATTGNCVATIDVGATNYSVSTIVEQLGSQGYLVVNRQDSTHFWRFGHSAGVLQIQRYNGTKDIDPLSSFGMLIKAKDILRIDVSGKSAKFYKNGTLLYTANSTLYSNVSIVGLQGSGATPIKFGAVSVDVF